MKALKSRVLEKYLGKLSESSEAYSTLNIAYRDLGTRKASDVQGLVRTLKGIDRKRVQLKAIRSKR